MSAVGDIFAQNQRILALLAKQAGDLHEIRRIAERTEKRCTRIDERLASGASKFQEHEGRISLVESAPKNGFHGQRILIVDDEDGLTNVIAEFLRGCGAVPIVARSVSAAHAALVEGLPDAAIVDLVLPGGDGAELAQELELLGVPVLVTSGYDERLEAWDEPRTLPKPSSFSIIHQKLLALFPASAKTDPAAAPTEPPTFSGELDGLPPPPFVDREAATMPGSRLASSVPPPSTPVPSTADESPQAKQGGEPPCDP